MLDRLCDIMTFGVLEQCKECNGGQFVYKSGVGYKCQVCRISSVVVGAGSVSDSDPGGSVIFLGHGSGSGGGGGGKKEPKFGITI